MLVSKIRKGLKLNTIKSKRNGNFFLQILILCLIDTVKTIKNKNKLYIIIHYKCLLVLKIIVLFA